MRFQYFIFILLVLFPAIIIGQNTFTNPIGGDQPDPYVTYKDGFYYFCATEHNGVKIRKSEHLHEVAAAPAVVVWEPNNRDHFGPVWAPELHYLNGKWYIYTTAKPCSGDDCPLNSIVLEGTTQNPQDPFVYKGILAGGIDGTVFQHDDGSLYYIWMRDENGKVDAISIAPMLSPTELGQPKVRISRDPYYDWETHDQYCNEGPAVLKRGNKVHIVYSASASWTRWYCLGRFTNADGDFLNPQSWEKSPDPIFQQSEENEVYSTGHCSFTKSPDGTEDWMMYHAKRTTAPGWENRLSHIQRFTWDDDDNPLFGIPHPHDVRIPVPSDGTCIQQELDFKDIPDMTIYDDPIVLNAESSYGLPVEFSVFEGNATVMDSTLTIDGIPGYVKVAAFQSGNDSVCAALETLQKINITDPDPVYGNGTGLTGKYYRGTNFDEFVTERNDKRIAFNWGEGSPVSGLGNDNFSVRWTGFIEPLYSGKHVFTIISDNGRKLWVDDKIIINKWINDWDIEYTGTVMLEAGQQYPIEIEYFELEGGANIKLYWALEFQEKSIVPTSQLFPEKKTGKYQFHGESFKVFADTNNNSIMIDCDKEWVERFVLSDSTGKKVYENNVPFTGKKSFMIANQPAGVYICKLYNGNSQYIQKISWF